MSRPASPTTVAIFGPGLLGGSLALAVQKLTPGAEVRIWARREEAVADIRARGIASRVTTSISDAAGGAHLIVLATPIGAMPNLARRIALCDPSPGCVVTDVGSVKGSVVNALEPIFANTPSLFIGSHPMAGSEKTGLDAARADLFEGAACILTPTPHTDPVALDRLRQFWSRLGCRLLEMSPQEHDRKVARISHLPHVMAAITTLAALRLDPAALDCAAGGFRDTTRVAAGDPAMWAGILSENRSEVLTALREATDTVRELLEIVEGLDEEKLRLFLAEAKIHRDRLTAGPSAYGND